MASPSRRRRRRRRSSSGSATSSACRIRPTHACAGWRLSARGRAAVAAGREARAAVADELGAALGPGAPSPRRRSAARLAARRGGWRRRARRRSRCGRAAPGGAAREPEAEPTRFASVLVVSATIKVTHVSDPGCPWAYSAAPHHAVLQWRYGDQLGWRLALIGLAETRRLRRARLLARQRRDRLHRLPPLRHAVRHQPRERNIGRAAPPRSSPHACSTRRPSSRCSARSSSPASPPPRRSTPTRASAPRSPGRRRSTPTPSLAAIDDPATESAYQEDRALVRTAAGSPTEFQGKAANTDGAVRYTAPVARLHAPRRPHARGRRVPADRGLRRRDREPRPGPRAARARRGRLPRSSPAFPYPLTTREVAAVMAPHLTAPETARPRWS